VPTLLGNSLGNRDYRIGLNPIEIDVFRVNSMVSGPTIFRDGRIPAHGGKFSQNLRSWEPILGERALVWLHAHTTAKYE
jgi:hypothetical protein